MIKVFTTQKDFGHFRKNLAHDSVGFVPTMGNLHEGHLSLLKKSIEENSVCVISIFVNPKQFGPDEDFEKYPRTLDADLAKISNVALHIGEGKEIVVFAPRDNNEIYPVGFNTIIKVLGVTEKLEGARRPGHFDGVTTVVYRLFKIVRPANAYFGQKDFQQCVVVKKMNEDLSMGINIHVMPIIRNSEGLALSSRNQYLNEQERSAALHLPRTLKNIEALIKTKQDYKNFVASELCNPEWDYLEILNADNLETPDELTRELVIIGVYKSGKTRLLDNILVKNL